MSLLLTRTVRLHPVQRAFCRSRAPVRAFVGGRGSGKSWVGCYDLIRRARPGRTYQLVAPTYAMLMDSEFRTFTGIARDLCLLGDVGGVGPVGAVRMSPPSVRLATGADVLFRSADDPERLRGPNLSGVALMEASLMRRDAYEISLASLREGGERGFLTAGLTPKGRTHWSFKAFAEGGPDTTLFRAATRDNPFLPPGFQDDVRRLYGDTQFARQELEGEFVAVEGAEWPPDLVHRPDRLFDAWPGNLAATVIALDPSKGASEDSDYQAFAVVRLDTNGTLWVDVEANREGVQGMVARGLALAREYAPLHSLVVEDNDGLGMLVDEFRRRLREGFVLAPPLLGVRNTVNKIFRLRRLGGLLANRHEAFGSQLRVRDTRGGRLLLDQMLDFPLGEHDDCLDALELALRRVEDVAPTLRNPGG